MSEAHRTPPRTTLLSRIGARLRTDLFDTPNDQFAGLNGLRGVSACLVVFIHVAIFSGNFPLVTGAKDELTLFQRTVNGFWVGLDVFFVLSGFLIGRILMSSFRRTGTVEFWTFFTRRSMRIFPAYYFALTFGIFVYARLDIHFFRFFTNDVHWTVFLEKSWQNYLYVLNYFFHSGESSIMSQAWSLCVEEHFYITLPILLWAVFKTRPSRQLPLLAAFTLIFFVTRAIQYALDPSIVLLEGFYYRSHNRFDEPMIGVLIAYFFVFHFEALKAWTERMGSWTWGIGALLVGSVWIFGGLQVQGAFAVIFQFQFMALGAGFMILNTLFLNNRFTRFFEHPIWYPVSRVSYGIFLNHLFVLYVVMGLPAFAIAGDMGPWRLSLFAGTVLAASILIAMITFVTIERPLIDLGHRISRRFRKPSLPESGAMEVVAHPPSRTSERGARRL